MSLFILDRTPLRSIDKLSSPPQYGDTIVYLRPGQDPEGIESEDLKKRGIETIWGETLLDAETSWQCDKIGGEFISRWYHAEGIDVSQAGPLSIGKMLDWELGRLVNPGFIIRTGEIVRCALVRFDDNPVYTDIADGEGIDRTSPMVRPLSLATHSVGRVLNRPLRQLDSVDSLHPLIIRNMETSLSRMLIRYCGGFRPQWILQRLRQLFNFGDRKIRPAIYLFMGQGTDRIVDQLRKTDRYRLMVNVAGIEGTQTLRPDHLIAFPALAEIRAYKRAARHLKKLKTTANADSVWALKGVGYDAILAGAALAVMDQVIWPNLFVLAQSRKMMEINDFAGFVINEENGFLLGTIVDYNKGKNKPIYYVGHGMNIHCSQSIGMSHNSPNVTYFTNGTDHASEYGSFLPPDQKPRLVPLGNPLTAMMNGVRNKKPSPHGKRILLLGTGFPGHVTASRARSAERFLADVFSVARRLLAQGWHITYRGHPHHSQKMEWDVAKAMGIEKQVNWKSPPEFSGALLEHDVVITAFSSTLYQSLWAGWPTIYYDPKFLSDSTPETFFRKELYVGLPAARDIQWPVAHDPDRLEQIILESTDPESLTARFPKLFATEYSERFIGPAPGDADQAIADFITDDLAGS